MAEKVTKRQQAVLDCIEDCIREKGYGPTVREVCQSLRPLLPFNGSRPSQSARRQRAHQARSAQVPLDRPHLPA